MKNRKKLLSVLLALVMLLSMPITGGIARAYAEGTDGPTELQETGPLDPASLHVKKLGETEDAPDADAESIDPDSIVRVSVFLKDKSVLEQGFAMRGLASNRRAAEYRKQLKKTQDELQVKIEKSIGHRVNVKWNLTLIANAISIEIPYRDIAKIEKLPGVVSVEMETQYEAPRDAVADHPNTANTSVNMVGATAAWAAGYTGYGTRIAIIDTGLDLSHQSVDEAAFLHAIDENHPDRALLTGQISDEVLNQLNAKTGKMPDLTAADTYYSAKVPFRFNYIDGNTDVTHLNDTQGEHGSHVAGISAANTYIPDGNGGFLNSANTVDAVGMAPDAQLFIMKVFGAGGGAYDSDYMVAIEDAVRLDCDVVNLSLGSSVQGWTFSGSYQQKMNSFADKAFNEGMVISISAGNSYSLIDLMEPANISRIGLYIEDVNMHTGGSPGTFVNSLCVAAAQNTLNKGVPLYFDDPQHSHMVFYAESLEGQDGASYGNAAMTTIAGTWDYVYIDTIGETADYATVNDHLGLSGESLTGKVVIVNRGGISFYQKGNNVKSYNPKGVIIANNADGVIHMDLTGFEGSFPMVSILKADADRIKTTGTAHSVGDITYYTGSVDVMAEVASTVADRADTTITDFSSWGAPGSLLMKPEITAPGGDINSIWGTNKTSSGTAGGSDQYELMSGTSMAAPHITGLAAVIAQYLRENGWLKDSSMPRYNEELTAKYSTRAINQSLMMSLATPMKNKVGNVYQYLSILQQGAGLVEVNKAVTAPSVVMIDDQASYLTGKTGAAADGKVKVELGDDPDRNGTYTYKFDIYNITDYPLTYTFRTDIFSQERTLLEGDGYHMAKTTTPMPATVTHSMTVVGAENFDHDVNKDGFTNEFDAQAILDYLSGEITPEAAATDLDLAAAKVDNDDLITSHDAQLILEHATDTLGSDTVPPHSKGTVTVTITLDAAAFGTANYPCGAYIEGFTYATCTSTANNGTDTISLAHEHSIPILGFYGSWTDPSMFDAASYVDALYHPDVEGQTRYARSSYTGHEDTNYMTVTVGGTQMKFAGNPYMVETSFPADRLAIRSDSKINSIVYNLYRAAAATGFAVTETDGMNGSNTQVMPGAAVTGSSVDSIYYSPSGGWQNTSTKSYTVNKTPGSYGFEEDDTFRIGFYAIPELNGMKINDSYNAANSAAIGSEQFSQLLLSNTLGRGAFVGYDFTVDDTVPTLTTPTLSGNTLSFTANDNQNLAYVAVLSLDGSVVYNEVAPGNHTYAASFDVTNAIAEANGYVAIFAADYAGNEAASYIKVNENASTPKEVYVRTSVLEAGEEYLIVSTNMPGIAKGLSHITDTTEKQKVYDALVNPGNSLTAYQPYINAEDVPENGKWTASESSGNWYFKNGEYYVAHVGTLDDVKMHTSTTTADWKWDSTNNRLYFHYLADRYVRYSGDSFVHGTSAASVYLYRKAMINVDHDPVNVTGITLTPTTLDLYKGNTYALTAKILPLTAADRSVDWSSSNNQIAAVDANGVVTAVSEGVATITAQSHDDPNVQATCTVTVTTVYKALNGFVADEEGKIHFAQISTNEITNGEVQWISIPDDRDVNTETNSEPLINAYLYSTSQLYATTNNFTGTSYIYPVDPSNFTVGDGTSTYVTPFGLATGPNNLLYGDCATFGFAYFLLSGPIAEVEEGEGALLPIGLLDTSETDMGGAYIASVCVASTSGSFPTYYVLDETGKIWKTSMKRAGASGISFTDILVGLLTYSFTDPVLVVDTGIGTSFQNQNIYYDGTYIYWAHCDGAQDELYIIEPNSGKVYNAGSFGEDVWPVGGMYVTGSVAPASVVPDDQTMDTEIDPRLPELVRERIMTPEIMARMQAESEKTARKAATTDAVKNLSAAAPASGVTRLQNMAPAAVSPVALSAGTPVLMQVSGVATNGEVAFSEGTASNNGLFTVTYPEGLTVNTITNGTADNLFLSVHHDAVNRTIKVAYAKKGTAIAANTPIITVQFDVDCVVNGDVVTVTSERDTSYSLTERTTVNVPGIGHDWDEPTYTWTETLNGAGNAPTYTVTAASVCKHDDTHVLTEDATVTGPVDSGNAWTYTATFQNTLFTTQTKTVSKMTAVTVTSSGNGTTTPGSTVAHVTGGGSFAPGATTQLVAPTVAGYSFLGWYPVNGTMPDDRITAEQTFTYTVQADGNDLIAVYEPQSGATYRLTITGTRFTIKQNASDEVTTQRGRYDDYYTAGSTVTVTYTGSDNFLYWINSNKKIVCTDASYTFVLMSNTDIDAVYSEQLPGETNHEALVLFVSAQANGQVISQRYYTDTEPIVYPVAPVKVGRTFVGWDKTEEQIHAAMATETRIRVYPIYQSNGDQYTTTIEYWIGDSYQDSVDLAPESIGTLQYVSAEALYENEPFSYWADEEGHILGYNNQRYAVVSTDDITIRAVYGAASTTEPIVRMTNAYATQNGADSIVNFTATWSIPDSFTIQEAGLLYAGLNRISLAEAEECLTLDYYSVGEKKGYILKPEFTNRDLEYAANAYFATSQPARQFIARAYVVIENNITHETFAIYSDNVIYASYNELANKVYYNVYLNTVQ